MPQYWFVAEALLALYTRLKDSRKPFTRDDLRAWSEKFQQRPAATQLALDHLERCSMVRKAPRSADEKPLRPRTVRYVLTTEGAAAASGAAQARRHAALSTAGRKGALVTARTRGAFCTRLWALFRMRRTLSAPDAAATLVDAGSDVARATNTASKYLQRWAASNPDAIQVSKQRGAHGANRFVLVRDLGPTPPVTTQKKAQGGAAA